MNIDGSNVVQVTSSPYADYHPRFSPDDSKIVFASSRDSDKSEIYLMNADGTDVIRLTNNEVSDYDPCFSPDGLKIFYTSKEEEQEYQVGPPKSHIFMMNTDGSDTVKIKDDPNGNYSDYDPVISPDGTKLLFSSPRTYNDEIYIMDVEGLLSTNLTNTEGWDGRPCFSPDGSKIAFSSDRDGNGVTTDIYIMNSDGKNIVQLTKNAGNNYYPRFSSK